MAKRLSCPRCHRTFSMPGHLGRHMKAIHGQSMSGGTVKRAKGRRGRPRGRRPAAVGFGAAGGNHVVATLQSAHAELSAQRGQLEQQLSALENAMSALGGGGGTSNGRRKARRRRGRPLGSKNRVKRASVDASTPGVRVGSLKDYVVRVLRQAGSIMNVQQVKSAVLKAGYKTKSKDLSSALNNQMGKIKGIKRMGRGQYRAA